MAKFTCNFISYILKRTVDITVVIPSVTIPEAIRMRTKGEVCSHVPKEKYPVIYLLHGMGNNHATWTGYSNVEFYAEERQIAVICMSAENKRYIEAGGDDFMSFVSKELPEFVCSMFPISKEPEHTYMAGFSMGGYGTFVHALNYPERFKAVGAFSAAVKMTQKQLTASNTKEIAEKAFMLQYSPEQLAEYIFQSGKKFPEIYMACGKKDPVYQNNREFCEDLRKMGAEVTWDEMEEYGHEWRFWNLEIEKFMDWLPRTDSYAKNGRRKI